MTKDVNFVVWLLTLTCVLVSGRSNSVEIIPDYYEQAGVNPYATYVDQAQNEYIDPFSGQLTLSYTDIFLPGNGGMDIALTRSYTSLQVPNQYWESRRTMGVGWTMSMGRVMIPSDSPLCVHHTGVLDSTTNNPVFEMPDGRRQTLYDAYPAEYLWITPERWKGECIRVGKGKSARDVFVMTSTDGSRYEFGHEAFDLIDNLKYFYLTSIEDINGNRITISYKPSVVAGLALMDEILAYNAGLTSNDGRFVRFSYLDEAAATVRINTITTPNQIWRYQYDTISGVAYSHFLSHVVRPDGVTWDYSYYPLSAQYGPLSMQEVVNPYDGKTTYTYGEVAFDPSTSRVNTVVVRKEVSGSDVDTGVWQYFYEPSDEGDKTTIVTPNGSTEHRFIGIMNARLSMANEGHGLWAIGLPIDVVTKDENGNEVQLVRSFWGSQQISHENYFRSSRWGETELSTKAPLALANDYTVGEDFVATVFSPSVYDDSDNYLEYFDEFGNPLQKEEIGNRYRKTEYSYYHQTYGYDHWLVKTVKNERVLDAGQDVSGNTRDFVTSRNFNPSTGRLVEEIVNGVSTNYTYHPAGDVHTVTNARGFTTTYSDYYRGIARAEQSQITDIETTLKRRVVNNSGTVAAITDEENRVKNFSYDEMNRLSGIDFPQGAGVLIDYRKKSSTKLNDRMLTRGNYSERENYDSLGRITCKTISDSVTGEQISTRNEFDELGQKTFQSFGSNSGCNGGHGKSFEYDVLGRMTRESFDDGAFKEYRYISAATVEVIDENSKRTTNVYEVYGSPVKGDVFRIQSPENVRTIIARDKVGNMFAIYQGGESGLGVLRTYKYDSRFFLEREVIPEISRYKYFVRDDVGNVLSWRIETASGQVTNGETYTYDGLNRLKTNDISSNGSIDERFEYYSDGLLKRSERSGNFRDFLYNGNGKLGSVSIGIVGASGTFNIGYEYNDLDYLEYLTYPSGRAVHYSPDAFGRPAQVGDFVTSIEYHPNGLINAYTYGNGATNVIDINASRNFVTRIQSTANDSVLDLTFGHDDLGNVTSVFDAIDSSQNISASYDGLSRLTSATGPWGEGLFEYDPNGNILAQKIGTLITDYEYLPGRPGNLVGINQNGLETTVSWDEFGAATRLRKRKQHTYTTLSQTDLARSPDGVINQITMDGVTTSNLFDADKMRVKRTKGGFDTYFIWSDTGLELATIHATDMFEEHIYLGTWRVASVDMNMRPEVSVTGPASVFEYGSAELNATVAFLSDNLRPEYHWEQISGIPITLNNSDDLTASFDVPHYPGNDARELKFKFSMTTELGTISKELSMDIAFTDNDADTLSDQYEQHFFGTTSYSADDDFDGDLISNLNEFLAGSDPTVPAPPSKVTGLKYASSSSQDSIDIEWDESERATSYTVYWSLNGNIDIADPTINKVAVYEPAFSHAGLRLNTPYYYVVTASNVAESLPSDELYAIPGVGGLGGIQPFIPGFHPRNILAHDKGADGEIGVVFLDQLVKEEPPKTLLGSSVSGTVSLEELLQGGIGFQYSPNDCTNDIYLFVDAYQDPSVILNGNDADNQHVFVLCNERDNAASTAYRKNTIVLNRIFFSSYTPDGGWSLPEQLKAFDGNNYPSVSMKLGPVRSVIAIGENYNGPLELYTRSASSGWKLSSVAEGSGPNFAVHASEDGELKVVLREGRDIKSLTSLSGEDTWQPWSIINQLQSDVEDYDYPLMLHHLGNDRLLIQQSFCKSYISSVNSCYLRNIYHDTSLGWLFIDSVNGENVEGVYFAANPTCQTVPSIAQNTARLTCYGGAITLANGLDSLSESWAGDSLQYGFRDAFGDLHFRNDEGHVNIALLSGEVLSEVPAIYDPVNGSVFYRNLSNVLPRSTDGYFPPAFANGKARERVALSYFNNDNTILHWLSGYGWGEFSTSLGIPNRARPEFTLFDTNDNLVVFDSNLNTQSFIYATSGLKVDVEAPEFVRSGDSIMLSASSNSPSTSYLWSSDSITLGSPNANVLSFVVPDVLSEEVLGIRLQAIDGAQAVEKHIGLKVSPSVDLPLPRITCREDCTFLSAEHSEAGLGALIYKWEQAVHDAWIEVGDGTSVYGPVRWSEKASIRLSVTNESGISAKRKFYPMLSHKNESSSYVHFDFDKVFAGKSRKAYPGESIVLTANFQSHESTEYDLDWLQVRGEPVQVTENAQTLQVEISNVTAPETLRFRVSAAKRDPLEGEGIQYSIDFVDVNVVPTSYGPIADAGENFTVTKGASVALSGLQSRSADDMQLTYVWTQIEGPSVVLSSLTQRDASFVAPATSELYDVLRFSLTVTDEVGRADSDVVTVTVAYDNQPPVISALYPAVVPEGGSFDIDISGTTDETQIKSIQLSQVSGPLVLDYWGNPASYFNCDREGLTRYPSAVDICTIWVVPMVSQDEILVFELRVTDLLGAESVEIITVTVRNAVVANEPPVAEAGPDQWVDGGQVVNLNGSASFDIDGSIASYAWSVTSGSASLQQATTATPYFVAPNTTASLTLMLTVTDDMGAQASDTMSVFTSYAGDIVPPTTTFNSSSSTSKGKTTFTVSMSSNEPGTTWFRVLSGDVISGATASTEWQPYSSLFQVQKPKSGGVQIEYYSVDAANNVETTRTAVLN